jgi:hypothetical protein
VCGKPGFVTCCITTRRGRSARPRRTTQLHGEGRHRHRLGHDGLLELLRCVHQSQRPELRQFAERRLPQLIA